MFYLFLFIMICNVFPAYVFARLFWENKEQKPINMLCLFNACGFIILAVLFLNYYVPYLNAVNNIGTDEWYFKFINSSAGEAYRLK